MKRNTQVIIDARRRQVASLVLRGLTQREVEEALKRQRFLNPFTHKAFSLGTINGDIKALQEQWRQEAQADIETHQARIWAELQEVKRAAWGKKDLRSVLQALKQETELLGVNAPQGLDLTTGRQPIKFTTIEVVKDYGEGSE